MNELIMAISAYQRHHILNDTEMSAILHVSPSLLRMARSGKRPVSGRILRGAARIPALFPYCVRFILPSIDERIAKEELQGQIKDIEQHNAWLESDEVVELEVAEPLSKRTTRRTA